MVVNCSAGDRCSFLFIIFIGYVASINSAPDNMFFFAGFGGGNHHHSMVVVYNIDLLTTTHEYQNAQKRPAPEGRSWNTFCPTPSNDSTNIDGGTNGWTRFLIWTVARGTRFHHYKRWWWNPIPRLCTVVMVVESGSTNHRPIGLRHHRLHWQWPNPKTQTF